MFVSAWNALLFDIKVRAEQDKKKADGEEEEDDDDFDDGFDDYYVHDDPPEEMELERYLSKKNTY